MHARAPAAARRMEWIDGVALAWFMIRAVRATDDATVLLRAWQSPCVYRRNGVFVEWIKVGLEAKQQPCVRDSVCVHRWLDSAFRRGVRKPRAHAPSCVRLAAFRGRVHGSQGHHVECQAARPTPSLTEAAESAVRVTRACSQEPAGRDGRRVVPAWVTQEQCQYVAPRQRNGTPAELHVHGPRPAGRLCNLHAPRPCILGSVSQPCARLRRRKRLTAWPSLLA